MGEFDGVRAKAIALIKKKGRDVVVLVPVEGTAADASKPWRVGAGTQTEFPCRAAVYDADATDGPANKICILPGDCGVVPDERMRVQVGAVQYAVINSKAYDPDGTPIGFKLELKVWPSISSQPQTTFSAG